MKTKLATQRAPRPGFRPFFWFPAIRLSAVVIFAALALSKAGGSSPALQLAGWAAPGGGGESFAQQSSAASPDRILGTIGQWQAGQYFSTAGAQLGSGFWKQLSFNYRSYLPKLSRNKFNVNGR